MITGTIQTQAGEVKQVATRLSNSDILGAVRVRWSIARNHYTVEPGLYAVGNPGEQSDVFVTANYKLSFDHLRKNLVDIDAWILVLDTKGINVWCAAGKGTFGTNELVYRIKETGLGKIISHRRIIVPQLGATGVSAYQVKALTSPVLQEPARNVSRAPADLSSLGSGFKIDRGFNVVFGPVRAADIKAFIANGYKTTAEMRKVTFNFYDRIKLIPVDIVYGRYKLLAALIIMFVISGLNRHGFSLDQAVDNGLPAILNIMLAYFAGILATPILLPYIPGRMFALKGLISGLVLSFILLYFNNTGSTFLENLSWFLLIPGISSFMAMNFTGSSTYTSLSGVKKEMKIFVPIQISVVSSGFVLFIVSNLI